MIIDSHAHYSVFQFNNQFPFLDEQDGKLIRTHGTRKELFERMREKGIYLFIEPSVRFENLDTQMAFAKENPLLVLPAVGVHPKYCLYAPWEEREKIRRLAIENDVIAIGETGLDFSISLTDEERETQKNWFLYQISLARELHLPLILHTRDADEEMLEILKNEKFPYGGVVHCFGNDLSTAKAYIDLGFALGIGGKLLQNNEEATILRETVRQVPLSSILVETDAPYVFPDLAKIDLSKKQKSKIRNTSLILPLVIDEIAHLKENFPNFLENSEIAHLQKNFADLIKNTVYENTIRIFHLRGNE